jgi:hypothetical protein
MNRLFPVLATALLAAALTGCSSLEEPAARLNQANVLPLAIDDSYQFRKILQSVYDPTLEETATKVDHINFERSRRTWGAIDSFEVTKRYGNYFTFFWRNSNRSDVTIRLEYRQAELGNHVMALERYYPAARGSHRSTFEITGDDFLEAGRVTAWRVLLIVDGRIVALRQSYMWR